MGPLSYLMPSDVFISGMDSSTEIRVMELVSYIMRGRDPNLLEDMVYWLWLEC